MLPINTSGKSQVDVYFATANDYVGVEHFVAIKKFAYASADTISRKAIEIIISNKTFLDLYSDV